MSRKRVDPARRAFDAWAGLTLAQQRDLACLIAGYQVREEVGYRMRGEDSSALPPPAKVHVRKLPKKAPAPAQADHHHGNAEVS